MKKIEFRPGRSRIRATFSAAAFGKDRIGKIDQKTGVLHDVQICLQGEAKGHDVFLDADFIRDLAKQGNSFSQGVKVRFGHPAMCSDALGTYLGRAKNFTVKELPGDGKDEKQVGCFADIHLADEAKHAPSGDLYSWVMETAEKSPDTFGQSIVFTYDDLFFYDKDGKKVFWSAHKDDFYDRVNDSDAQVFAVLGELLGTDFTDSPAATTGVFSATDLAAEAEQMLEDHPQIMDILTGHPDSVKQFVARYNVALKAAGKKQIVLVTEDETFEKRLSNLQSAKDSRIAELQKQIDKQNNEITTFTQNLETLKKESSVLRAERDDATAALADARKQLDTEKDRRLRLVGATLEDPDSSEDFDSRIAAAHSPEERDAIRAERDRSLLKNH